MGASGSDLPGFGGSLALSLLSLGVVCVAAFVVLRWLGRRGIGGVGEQHIRVLGRCVLEPRRSVCLIQVSGRCFLVGVSDGPMSLLAEIDASALSAQDPADARLGSSFAEILAKMFRKGGR